MPLAFFGLERATIMFSKINKNTITNEIMFFDKIYVFWKFI